MPSAPDAWIEEVVALDGMDVVLLRPPDAEALIDEEAFEHDEALPYWAELWPSGVALARALRGRSMRGARVLELGCGLGLASIVAALHGADVLATDWSDEALAATRANAERNGATLEVLRVDFNDARDVVDLAPFDLILAADVLYERRLVPTVLHLLARLRSPVLLADPGRATAEPFLGLAASAFKVHTRKDPNPPHVAIHYLVPR
jgi:predicted nicotinamide N-methyase